MDTNWLSDLMALARALNFSRAAEMRGITQPAFGRRVRALEAWCGATLVDRKSHRLQLTEAGRIMLKAAEEVDRRLERARHEIAELQAETAALTVAATHALSFNFLPGWLRGLGAEAAGMPMRLLSDNMNQCERIIMSGGSQFLLCHYHSDSPIDLTSSQFRHIVLARDRLIPVCQCDDHRQPRFSLPGRVEQPLPYLTFDPTSGMGRILSSQLLDGGRQAHLRPVMTSHLAMALKAMALEGRGLTWLPETLAADELGPEGSLTLAGTEQWAVEVEIVLFRRRARMPVIAERFWEIASMRAVDQRK